MFGRNVQNHRTLRKYVVYFGTLFSDMYLTRDDVDGTEIQKMKVALNYGPKEKYLARLQGNPDLNRQIAIQLPRMCFEIVNIRYDSNRKLSSTGKLRGQATKASAPNKSVFQYNPVPYDIDINLYVMVKNAEDGTRIIEQIIPNFTPEFTSTLNINKDLGCSYDVPLVLNNIDQQDTYEGDFVQRRAIVWTLSFTLKGWIFGPTREGSLINQVEINFELPTGDIIVATPSVIPPVKITTTPGLTANGQPTTDPLLTISKDLIKSTDNYGFITEFDEDL